VLADIAGHGSRFAIRDISRKDLFGGPWLAGDFRKAQEKRLVQAAAADCEHSYRFGLRRLRLQDYGIEILYAPRQFRTAAQDFIELLDLLGSAAARSKSSWPLAFSRFFFNRSGIDPPLVSRKRRSRWTSTSYSSLLHPAKHGARHIFISE